MNPSGRERRAACREATSLRVRLRPLGGEGSRWANIADVSRGGALVEGLGPLRVGERVLLRISSPLFKHPMRVRAEVTRTAPGLAGVRFIEVSPDVARDIDQIVGGAAKARYAGAWNELDRLRETL